MCCVPILLLTALLSNVTNDHTEMFKFEVPSLTVGTLDTLMVRAETAWCDDDELSRVASLISWCCRKPRFFWD